MIIYPPNYTYPADKPVIFLAGPIQGARDWQSEAAAHIINKGKERFVVANPRRDVAPEKFDFVEQTDWETFFLRRAARILFWLEPEQEHIPGRSYAQTSRFELGEWFGRGGTYSIILGIDAAFHGARYLVQRFRSWDSSFEVSSSLEDTCDRALRSLKERK